MRVLDDSTYPCPLKLGSVARAGLDKALKQYQPAMLLCIIIEFLGTR